MNSIRYTADHEWIRLDDDGTATVGITRYAEQQLGDIVFVQLPEVGTHFGAADEAVVIESVKAAADVKMPVAGEIVAVNGALADAPETVNEDPLEAGWFIKIRPDNPDDVAALLDQGAYDELTGS